MTPRKLLWMRRWGSQVVGCYLFEVLSPRFSLLASAMAQTMGLVGGENHFFTSVGRIEKHLVNLTIWSLVGKTYLLSNS